MGFKASATRSRGTSGARSASTRALSMRTLSASGPNRRRTSSASLFSNIRRLRPFVPSSE
ncbi:MAG: hypothetical protein IPJ35_08775 [Elusimicrobia bacterium]|nr:hypothetical protein [Elusimicrobiota bacterium]